MAAALSVSTPAYVLQTVTVTGTGFAATTALNVVITGQQGTRTIPVTSDGSGGFTVTYIPQTEGSAQIDVYTAPAGSLVTLTVNVSDS